MKRVARIVFTLLLLTASAQAADITVVVPEISAHEAVVLVRGRFLDEDGQAFAAKVAGIRKATVYFVSHGGRIGGAMQMGLTIHRREFHTAVSDFQYCVSACALAWLGGTKRFAGHHARIGFHSTREDGVKERSLRGDRMIADYLVKYLGLPVDAPYYVTMADPTDMTILSLERAKKYGIEFTRMNIPDYNPLP